MNESRLLLDAFNIYYSKGKDALDAHDIDGAIRNFSVAAETMYKLAKNSTGLLQSQRVKNADDLSAFVDELVAKKDSLVKNSNMISNDESETFVPKAKTTDNDGVSLEDALNHLYSLEGLSKVKEEVNDLINEVKINKLRQQKGLKVTKIPHHMVFSGNPGTGKTTVARIMGQIYHALGLLSKGHFVEVDRAGLVGPYIGHTEMITKQRLDEAKGGILFIDEAYSLKRAGDDSSDYGQIVIDILTKDMEDYRDDLVIIVAGYEEEMKKFIESNPGLNSRFTTYLHFEDYTGEELFNIFEKFAEESEYRLDDEANKELRKYFILSDVNKFSGNARDVRNLFNQTRKEQNKRLESIASPSLNDLMTIKVEDMPFLESTQEKIDFNKANEPIQKNSEVAYKKDDKKPEDKFLNNVVDNNINSEYRFDWNSLPDVKFDDIAGLEDVKEAVRTKVLLPLEHPEAFEGYVKKNGGGLFLYGPPGTGKTMVAAAIANEIGAKFCAVKPSDLIHQGGGNTEKAVKALFSQARQYPCSIIYFDEMDALAQKNTKSSYSRQLRSELLAQMQGIDSYRTNNDQILFLIAATNKPWDVDSAFVRPGRFGTKIYVGLPDADAIHYIVENRLNKIRKKGLVTICEDINIDEIVSKMNGFNGSDVSNLLDRVEEISAVRNVECGSKYICSEDFDKALSQITTSVQVDDIEKLILWKEQNN